MLQWARISRVFSLQPPNGTALRVQDTGRHLPRLDRFPFLCPLSHAPVAPARHNTLLTVPREARGSSLPIDAAVPNLYMPPHPPSPSLRPLYPVTPDNTSSFPLRFCSSYMVADYSQSAGLLSESKPEARELITRGR